MENGKWIEEAKEIAETQAEIFVCEIRMIADGKNLDREWFLH